MLYIASARGWLAGDWPLMGGRSQRYCGGLTAGFQWWHSGDITRTQNVSEYMLVLAVYLVVDVMAQISGEIHCYSVPSEHMLVTIKLIVRGIDD